MVCSRLGANGKFIGIDQDEDAVVTGEERLKQYGQKVSIAHSNYSDMVSVVRNLGFQKVDGILLDLGVSSFQLDTQERGFSYRVDAPLDMRMDRRQELSAAIVVNEYSETELFHIIRDYGEDRFAKNIAKNIVTMRKKEPILTTGRLAEIVSYSIPMKIKKQGGHPAKRTFQAIRIEVNHELEVLERTISDMIDLLNPGGRNENPCTCPPDFPVCVCGNKPKGRQVTRKPVLPSEEEMEKNPRSKSAKLRIFERI